MVYVLDVGTTAKVLKNLGVEQKPATETKPRLNLEQKLHFF